MSKLFGGWLKENLLVRAVPGKDTGRERGRAKREGRPANVSFFGPDQYRTPEPRVRIEPYALAAGAGRVVLMIVGKYPGPYYIRHGQLTPDTIAPYELRKYDDAHFVPTTFRMRQDEGVREMISTSFVPLRDDREYPVA